MDADEFATISDVSIDWNAAMRIELEDAIARAGYDTPNDYFRAHEIDRRNFYRTLKRDPQISWIRGHLARLGVSTPVYFDAVEARVRRSTQA